MQKKKTVITENQRNEEKRRKKRNQYYRRDEEKPWQMNHHLSKVEWRVSGYFWRSSAIPIIIPIRVSSSFGPKLWGNSTSDFYIIRGQSKKSESWADHLLICWMFFLFYSNNMHEWWMKVWFLTCQMPVLSGWTNFDPLLKTLHSKISDEIQQKWLKFYNT